ncbi:MAG: hypothetical protein ACQKBT_04090, partial [Puniceicoccales bacterium]
MIFLDSLSSSISTRGKKNGFALIVSLSLLALVLLLLVSISAMVQIEARSSSNQTERLLTRSNAILALQIALGNLQKAAGPDQRVTGQANLIDSTLPDSQKNWTGVWDVSDHDSLATHVAPTEVVWLVSGANLSTDPLSPGETITEPVTLLSIPGQPENDVSAALLEVDANGHFGYWIGDEGVKAKVNTTDPHHNGTSTEEFFSQMSAQRMGIERITIADGGDSIGDWIDPLDSGTESLLQQVQHRNSLVQLSDGFQDLPSQRYHDITTTSYGLLTDVNAGGLKQDLSLAFEMDLDDFNANDTFAAGGETVPYVDDHRVNYLFTFDRFQAPLPKVSDPLVRGPTWHLLRNYYRLYKGDDPDRFEPYKLGNPLGVEADGSGYKIAARSYFPMTEYNQPQASELIQAYYDLDLDPNVGNYFLANTGTEPIPRVT